jgi:mono/diheme cytochrome c family protein
LGVKTLLIAGALVCCVFQGALAQSAKANAPSAANGKVVFMRAGCYACHGTVGHGGAGARLAPNTLPIAAFQLWVRNGTPGWSVGSGMPAFPAKIVTDQEIEDVRAYLADLPAPKAVKDIPLLNQ